MSTIALHTQHSRFFRQLVALLGSTVPSGHVAGRQGHSAVEALRVRELASRYADTDPGFAADLYAAAARHEGLGDS